MGSNKGTQKPPLYMPALWKDSVEFPISDYVRDVADSVYRLYHVDSQIQESHRIETDPGADSVVDAFQKDLILHMAHVTAFSGGMDSLSAEEYEHVEMVTRTSHNYVNLELERVSLLMKEYILHCSSLPAEDGAKVVELTLTSSAAKSIEPIVRKRRFPHSIKKGTFSI